MAKNEQPIIHGLLQDDINYPGLIRQQANQVVNRMPFPKEEVKSRGIQKVKKRKNNR